MIAFGPVPSRRLGQSLGINNIPPKACTYSCVYCQIGRTSQKSIDRHRFYEPRRILRDVENRAQRAREFGEPIDYLTFVANGEPTLDVNLGEEIELLRSLGIRIAVITNSTLLWRTDLREELMQADWVSLKVDSVREETWSRISRPHRALTLRPILEGMLEFARVYHGTLATETMLVNGINDTDAHAEQIGDFLTALGPDKAYLSIPIRPPAEEGVEPPNEQRVNRFYQILAERTDRVECLFDHEDLSFACTGDAEQDMLSITAVHPMREEAVSDFLKRANGDWSVVRSLIDQGKLIETTYEGHRFYMRATHEHVPATGALDPRS